MVVGIVCAGIWDSRRTFVASPGRNREGAERAAEFRTSLNSDTPFARATPLTLSYQAYILVLLHLPNDH